MASPYNLFATLLAQILAAHLVDGRPMTINDLDSEARYGDGHVHRETVRRLTLSLATPYAFPTLGKHNLRKVVAIAGLDNTERLTLVAAIIATKIQAELAPRIGPARAYLAAEKVVAIIAEGLSDLEDDDEFNGSFRRGVGAMIELPEFDRIHAAALAAIDRGHLALTSARYVSETTEKRATAQHAYDAFTQALAALDQHREDTDAWHFWRAEAEQGQRDAQDYL